MKTVFTVSLFACMMLIASIAWSEIVYVNGTTGDDATGERGNPDKPFKTIQKGIDVAVSGEDTVLVADGTYKGDGNKNLDFKGKAITVTSENGAENCIIDCEKSGRGFYFHSGETEASMVSGFTITNGYISGYGGGISCRYNSSPTIQYNTITGNSANDGGGIYCDDSSPTIQNNTITTNLVSSDGGGIYCNKDASPTIQNNEITGNLANEGGGIYCVGYEVTKVINNTIAGNVAEANGGGIYCASISKTEVLNTILWANSPDQIYDDSSSLTITYSDIQGGWEGEGNIDVTPSFVDPAGDYHLNEGIYCDDSSPKIINNTISRNLAKRSGGGIYCWFWSSTRVKNTILWADSPEEIYVDISSSIDITYSDILGDWEGDGNIDGTPSFVDPDNGDYRLSEGSCCIGAGEMDEDVPDKDKDGNPRPSPADSDPDIGAYENPLASQLSYYGAIYGIIRNSWTDSGIGEAKVSANPGSHVTYTDKNGFYISDNLPVGTYTVTTSAIGYYPKLESDIVEVIACESSRVDPELIPIIVSPPGGNWLEFDGVDDYAKADDSDSLDVGDEPGEDLTIEAWVYPRSFPSVADSSAIIVSKPGAYKLSLKKDTAKKPGFLFMVYGEGAEGSISSKSTNYETAIWYHIVGVFDNSTDTIALYINGEGTNPPGTFTSDLNNSPGMFYVGGPPLPPDDNEYFDGLIDEIRVSDVVRYSADFTPPSEPFTPDANTRALWHFDEPIGSTSFEDSSGNNNTLTGVNGAHIGGGELSPGDVSGNNAVTAYDASLALQHVVGRITLPPVQQQAADVTGNGTVTALDVALILQYTVGLITQFPVQQVAPALTAKDEKQVLSQIIAELEDISLTTEQKHVLERLKHLIGQQSIPEHTSLLQNYPNPFNPETWLPYQLAQDASVTIRIYNVKGQLIRTLHLGNKNAGVYMTKDKSAHWDGKNSLGQSVASGLYFYTLQVEHPDRGGAGTFTATRRMVIVK